MPKSNRRRFIAQASALAAAATVPAVAHAQTGAADKPVKKVHYSSGKKPEKTPLFNGIVSYGNMVFIAGIGAHFEGDIKAHTKHVLDEIQKRLESVGSSMDKVLKVNVYLNDLKDYAGMNEMFLGRFGAEPPVRTTIAAPAAFRATRWSRSTASRSSDRPALTTASHRLRETVSKPLPRVAADGAPRPPRRRRGPRRAFSSAVGWRSDPRPSAFRAEDGWGWPRTGPALRF